MPILVSFLIVAQKIVNYCNERRERETLADTAADGKLPLLLLAYVGTMVTSDWFGFAKWLVQQVRDTM